MKSALLALLLIANCAMAADKLPEVTIGRKQFGSGQPGMIGVENATNINNDLWFAPQFMPYAPTAATIYPRVIEVPCTKDGNKITCDGYYTDYTYRGEYLYFTPKYSKDKDK